MPGAQVAILNADNGVFLSWVDRSTLADITVSVTRPRINAQHLDDFNGHHALSILSGQANLVTRFNVAVRYIHDLTVAGSARLNVWMEGRGVDLNIDCHRTAPWANLFTVLSLGLGTRPFASGGRSDRGAHAGRGNTFWGLRPASGAPLPLPACEFGPLLNLSGATLGAG
ncbi:hypothetical protein CHLNCDRAFT_140927 [Chlorella variabilis]|uniref:Uncharacterized protein n=1 Tax=Chlorella variabilis TaxID=554065 RepID=E1Z6J2_CHLVA|nr:hypothetical protein CHLNCDRAFT_140927 [Chlorella variabilis]EFN58659.1 hypothetical protein CHLNCDRAFT_140927 [Chlorella variabilis]|eukprot:XP_005850761.1 hypothetical protein CHLNCDRAFT_140927 [Chlorella variabilis]